MRESLAVLLVGLATCLQAGCDDAHLDAPAAAVPRASVATPVVKQVIDYEKFTGRTDAEKTVDVRARVSGYLTKILFKPGAEVTTGQSLFEIDPRPYQAELDRAEGSLARSNALVDRIRKDQERAMKLPPGTITPQELDKIAADLAEAKASVQIAAADVDKAKLDLEFTDIKAPFGGRIGRNLISEGNLVSAASPLAEPLATIVTVDPMHAYFDCDELKMLEIQRRIRAGKMKSAREEPNSVPVEMGLGNEGTDYPHVGTLDFVNNRVIPSTGTLQVRGLFPNPLIDGKHRLLSPGLFVRVRLPMGEPHDAVLISESAKVIDQNDTLVYVLGDQNKVEARKVTLGELHDGLIEVVEGVLPSDRVVVSNTQRIRPGVEINPRVVEMRPGPAPTLPPEEEPVRDSASAAGEEH